MFKNDALLNILTPEAISALGEEKIKEVKELGTRSKYLIISRNNNAYEKDQRLDYQNKKIKELTNNYVTKGLDEVSKVLFCSEVKLSDDSKIIELLNIKGISFEDITELNQLIGEYQHASINYTMSLIKLEQKYDLKLDQAISILKLKPALLNNNYHLNKDDMELYSRAQKMILFMQSYNIKKTKVLENLENNPTFKKLCKLSFEYFGINYENIFMLINKINELMITNPERINHREIQKILK